MIEPRFAIDALLELEADAALEHEADAAEREYADAERASIQAESHEDDGAAPHCNGTAHEARTAEANVDDLDDDRIEEVRAAGQQLVIAAASRNEPRLIAALASAALLDETLRCERIASGAVADLAPPQGLRTGSDLVQDVRAGRITPRLVIVAGLLRQGDLFILFGPPGMGKSQLALALAVALALGADLVPFVIDDPANPLLEVASPTPLRVLFVNAEDDAVDVGIRLVEHLRARGLPDNLDNLFVWTPTDSERNLASGPGAATLERLIAEHDIDVVILDNLTNAVLIGKSDEGEVTEWINTVPRRLRDRYGVTFAMLGHSSKGTRDGDARSALERLFGSMAWGGCADGAVMLDWVPGQPTHRRLIHAKARGFAPFETTTLTAARGDCVFGMLGAAGESRSAGRPEKATVFAFQAALSPRGDWVDSATVCARMDIGDSTLRHHLPAFLRVLGGAIEVRGGAGRKPREYRLRTYEELAAAERNGARP